MLPFLFSRCRGERGSALLALILDSGFVRLGLRFIYLHLFQLIPVDSSLFLFVSSSVRLFIWITGTVGFVPHFFHFTI